MNISTAASMALVWLSAGLIQQYRNVYSQELKTQFSMKFGQIVTVMTGQFISSLHISPSLNSLLTPPNFSPPLLSHVHLHLITWITIGLLVTSALSLFVALFIALISSFSILTATISIVILSLGFIAMVCSLLTLSSPSFIPLSHCRLL